MVCSNRVSRISLNYFIMNIKMESFISVVVKTLSLIIMGKKTKKFVTMVIIMFVGLLTIIDCFLRKNSTPFLFFKMLIFKIVYIEFLKYNI